MEATSDGEMESLIRSFEQIYQGYKDAIAEVQSLKSSYNAETRRLEALEATCNNLRTDNERLRKLYTESLTKLANQMKCRTKFQSMKEELKRADDKLLCLEDEHRKTTEMLKQEDGMKIADLGKQVSCSLLQQLASQAMINRLQQDLAAYKKQIDILTNSLEQVTADVDLKYQHEIQDLKDCILVEQEEKNELHKKLQNAENDLLIIRAKQAEQHRDTISIRHNETLKQKIMKLRKENESLKRKLLVS